MCSRVRGLRLGKYVSSRPVESVPVEGLGLNLKAKQKDYDYDCKAY